MALTELQNEMITNLSGSPDRARALMAEHARAPDGRCRVCRAGNFESPRMQHPCTLYTVAALAVVDR